MNLRNEDVFNKVRTLTAVATQLKIGGVEDSRRLLRCYNWNMWKYFLDHQNLSDKCSGMQYAVSRSEDVLTKIAH